MTKPLFALLLAVLCAAPSSPLARFEARAIRYLDPSVSPRPKVYEGEVPTFSEFTYRDHRCWGLGAGVVCSACYNHPRDYLGQMTVLCPWNRQLCRFVLTPDDSYRFGVDPNQCVRR